MWTGQKLAIGIVKVNKGIGLMNKAPGFTVGESAGMILLANHLLPDAGVFHVTDRGSYIG